MSPVATTDATKFVVSPEVHILWHCYEDPEGPGSHINIDIWHERSPQRIGYLEAYIVPCNSSMDNFIMMCDDHSQELLDFASELSQQRISLSRFFRDGDLLFPHLFEIAAPWRGQGIGAAVFKFMLEQARDELVSVCAFNPHPLQFGEQHSPEEQREYDAALASLRRYYVETFGAKRLRPNGRYYYIRL